MVLMAKRPEKGRSRQSRVNRIIRKVNRLPLTREELGPEPGLAYNRTIGE
jgi:hypothetical protein